MNATDAKLFADYASDGSVTNRNWIVERHIELVDVLVAKFARQLPKVDRDDFRLASYVALISAVERFDPDRGWEFGTFAAPRIRRAIIDACRDADPLARGCRARMKAWQRAADSSSSTRRR